MYTTSVDTVGRMLVPAFQERYVVAGEAPSMQRLAVPGVRAYRV